MAVAAVTGMAPATLPLSYSEMPAPGALVRGAGGVRRAGLLLPLGGRPCDFLATVVLSLPEATCQK